ncbi:MAG: peptidoglycan DD-metalloendopeptidase family protein [Rhodospirillales bacterium]|jgi:murein DD-endopeptidase MepM/ murein hydrolase activator NlpD|nr:peptidoglycan DD-metalloendopeptidase family protein [Rhodospirillales bacterium]
MIGNIGKTDTQPILKTIRARLKRIYPERQIVVRTRERVSYLHITYVPQFIATLMLIAATGWIGFSSVSYMLNDRIISAKNGQIVNARMAYKGLLDEVSAYQNKFISITRELEENHSLMLSLVEQNTELQQNLSSVAQELKVTEADRHSVIQTRERLKNNLGEIQENLHSLTSKNFLLRDNLDSTESDLQIALSERNNALDESDRMTNYASDLEGRLSSLQMAQLESISDLTTRTDNNISNLKRVISIAGLDIADFIDGPTQDETGQGGPFIAMPDMPGEELKSRLTVLDNKLEHLEILQKTMQRIPFVSPLTAYYMTSKYGKRHDPLNNKWSMHYGVDLGGTNKTPVYSTAPGKVTYAGKKGKYGNMIEITHGEGIITRFAHLNKILVKKGQEIEFYEKIGLLGSTGRSTGPHLHYEVVVAGKPMDPMNFIKAGRYVFQE